jgi:hypothetical protein
MIVFGACEERHLVRIVVAGDSLDSIKKSVADISNTINNSRNLNEIDGICECSSPDCSIGYYRRIDVADD